METWKSKYEIWKGKYENLQNIKHAHSPSNSDAAAAADAVKDSLELEAEHSRIVEEQKQKIEELQQQIEMTRQSNTDRQAKIQELQAKIVRFDSLERSHQEQKSVRAMLEQKAAAQAQEIRNVEKRFLQEQQMAASVIHQLREA